MGMFMGSIRFLAGDYEKATRWALVNLTDDDANDMNRQKLTQLRIVGISQVTVTLMGGDGKTYTVPPVRIQRVW